jgi:hypothetical protein
MELIIEGVIRRICKPFEHSSGFRKCEVHIEVQDGEYSEIIPVEFLKDLTDEALGLTVGAPIKATCNVRGREWEKKVDKLGNPLPYPETVIFVSFPVWKYELPEPKSIKEQVMDQANDNPAEADDFPF